MLSNFLKIIQCTIEHGNTADYIQTSLFTLLLFFLIPLGLLIMVIWIITIPFSMWSSYHMVPKNKRINIIARILQTVMIDQNIESFKKVKKSIRKYNGLKNLFLQAIKLDSSGIKVLSDLMSHLVVISFDLILIVGFIFVLITLFQANCNFA